jgi:hypothetical protein
MSEQFKVPQPPPSSRATTSAAAITSRSGRRTYKAGVTGEAKNHPGVVGLSDDNVGAWGPATRDV